MRLDPIWALVLNLAGLFSIQLPACGLEMQLRMAQSLGPCNCVWDLEEAPGSWLLISLAPLGEWINGRRMPCLPSSQSNWLCKKIYFPYKELHHTRLRKAETWEYSSFSNLSLETWDQPWGNMYCFVLLSRPQQWVFAYLQERHVEIERPSPVWLTPPIHAIAGVWQKM